LQFIEAFLVFMEKANGFIIRHWLSVLFLMRPGLFI